MTEEFFELMSSLLTIYQGCECIISDYGSIDGIKEVVTESYPRLNYLYTQPNEEHWLNIPKCLNNAVSKTEKSIIAPIGSDFRFTEEVIERIISFFTSLGSIILRPTCHYMDENHEVSLITYSPYALLRTTVLMSGGWDERMYAWGKEEDDLLSRIIKYQNLYEVKVRGFGYVHLYHDNSFAEAWHKDPHNTLIAQENYQNNGKNLVNSYWKV